VTKIFIKKNIIRERKMCFCEADLNKEESCKKGLKWFEYNYDIKEWDNLELFYNQYVNIECQENNRI
jgi:hypothetical protein